MSWKQFFVLFTVLCILNNIVADDSTKINKGGRGSRAEVLQRDDDGLQTIGCDQLDGEIMELLGTEAGEDGGLTCETAAIQVTRTKSYLIRALSKTTAYRFRVSLLGQRNRKIDVKERTIDLNTGVISELNPLEEAENKYDVKLLKKSPIAEATNLLSEAERINADETIGWHAAVYSNHLQEERGLGHIDMTPEEKKMFPVVTDLDLSEEQLAAIPATYDPRGSNTCKSMVPVNQGECGSCYAFASAKAYNDRICRASNGAYDITLSEQDIVSCYRHGSYSYNSAGEIVKPSYINWNLHDGCQGGGAANVYILMQTEPKVPRWADPYTGKDAATGDNCGTHTASNAMKFSAGKVYMVQGINAIKNDIVTKGAVYASMDVMGDFHAYSGGVYTYTSGGKEGGHAVALVGWGSGYWIAQNSWGINWGEGGFFRIRMGTDEVGIESGVIGVDVKIPTTCSSKPACKNGGEFTSSCSCKCEPGWGGSDCGTCQLSCKNGGNLDTNKCQCLCPPGYFGQDCGSYVLAQWESVSWSSQEAVVNFKWNLPDYKTGSTIQWYADLPASNNPAVGGQYISLSSTGSSRRSIKFYQSLSGYPNNQQCWVNKISRGVNEFGESKGFVLEEMPCLKWDQQQRCLYGGHKPTASVPICSNANYPSGAAPAPAPEPNPVTPAPEFAPAPAPVTPSPTNAPTVAACPSACPRHYIGDNYCDDECNVAACQYDGGDCNKATPSPTRPPTVAPTVPPPPPPSGGGGSGEMCYSMTSCGDKCCRFEANGCPPDAGRFVVNWNCWFTSTSKSAQTTQLENGMTGTINGCPRCADLTGPNLPIWVPQPGTIPSCLTESYCQFTNKCTSALSVDIMCAGQQMNVNLRSFSTLTYNGCGTCSIVNSNPALETDVQTEGAVELPVSDMEGLLA